MASAGRTRPSLLGTAPDPHPPREFEVSILQALDTPNETVQRRTARAGGIRLSGLWLAAGLVVVAASAALWWHRGAGAPLVPASAEAPLLAAGPATATPAALRAPAASDALAAVVAVTAGAASAAPAEAPQPARIEDVGGATPAAATPAAAAGTTADAPSTPPQSTPSPFERLAQAEPEPAATGAAKPAAQPIAKPAGRGTAKPNAQASARREANPATRDTPRSTRTAQAKAPAQAGRPAAGVAAAGATAAVPARAAKAGSTSADADVEIMAALMTHMNEPPPAKSALTDASIADLVRHCRGLPGAEARACQRRICQGYWGRADACPQRERQATLRAG